MKSNKLPCNKAIDFTSKAIELIDELIEIDSTFTSTSSPIVKSQKLLENVEFIMNENIRFIRSRNVLVDDSFIVNKKLISHLMVTSDGFNIVMNSGKTHKFKINSDDAKERNQYALLFSLYKLSYSDLIDKDDLSHAESILKECKSLLSPTPRLNPTKIKLSTLQKVSDGLNLLKSSLLVLNRNHNSMIPIGLHINTKHLIIVNSENIESIDSIEDNDKFQLTTTVASNQLKEKYINFLTECSSEELSGIKNLTGA